MPAPRTPAAPFPAVSVDFLDFSLEYKRDLGAYDWLLVELRKGISSVFSFVVSRKIGERSRARVGRVHRCGMCVVEALVRVSVLCVVSYVSIFFVEISSMTCIQVV